MAESSPPSPPVAATAAAPGTSPPPPVPTPHYDCLRSVARGAAVGSVLGAGFHAIAGPAAMVIGQPNLRYQLIVRNSVKAAARIGAVFGVFTAVRCGAESVLNMPLSGPFMGGAVAVAIPTALEPKRSQFLQAYFKEHAKQSFGRAGVIGTSALSGAIVLGSLDHFLRYMDWRW